VNSADREAYARAGVDVKAADKAKELIKRLARSTSRPEVLTDIGLFGSMFQLKGYTEPVLVSSVDGVGTKLKIASFLNKHDTIGIDLVNHCVNDILTCGASPLFFLDYIAMGKLVPERVESIVSGIAQACKNVGCALVGGETAEMPGIYQGDDYDLVGFIVGAVEKAIPSPRVISFSVCLPVDCIPTATRWCVRSSI
jgi:phosphoribosylformylglycinamidine cyclo-ligase